MATPDAIAMLAAIKRLSAYAKACGLQHGTIRIPGEVASVAGSDIVREADEAIGDFEFFFADEIVLPPQATPAPTHLVHIAIAPEDRL